MSGRAPLLILDLDETLISSSETEPARGFDFRLPDYWVTLRPHLSLFLDTVFGWFEVAVWTSSSDRYAEAIVPRVFPDPTRLRFVWADSRCTRGFDGEMGEYVLKDLHKVRRQGYRLERVLVIDDSPGKLRRHYGNLLRVAPFEGDLADRELADVLPFLDWIRGRPDFRRIEKRAWRTHPLDTGS